MPEPADRVTTTSGGKAYRWPGPDPAAYEAPSVTTIVNAVSSSAGLATWASGLVASAAVRDLASLVEDVERDRAATIKALAAVPDRVRDEAGSLGSRVHNAIAADADPDQVDSDLGPYLVAWRAWLQRTGARVVLSERTVWHPDYGGTLDAVIEQDGRLLVVDFKTGRTLMPAKVRLQLTGYASAAFVGEAGVVDRAATDVLHRLDGAAVVHLRPELPDGLRVYSLAIDGAARAAWRAAVELYAFYRTARLVPSDTSKEDPMDTTQIAAVAAALEAAAAALHTAATALTSPEAPATATVREGDRHRPDHNPVKRNSRGLFCPTKVADDSWCPWTAAA